MQQIHQPIAENQFLRDLRSSGRITRSNYTVNSVDFYLDFNSDQFKITVVDRYQDQLLTVSLFHSFTGSTTKYKFFIDNNEINVYAKFNNF